MARRASASAASSLAAFAPLAATYDAVLAKGLVETYRARLAAIDHERIVTPRLDVDAASRALLSVHATLTQAPGLYAQLGQLDAAKVIDIGGVAELKDLAFLVMFTYREATEAGAFKSTAKISEALDKDSARLDFEVREAGRFLLRYDPRREERFPSLYAVGRGGGPKKKGKKAGGAAEAGEGAGK
jgi:hypothetical protein